MQQKQRIPFALPYIGEDEIQEVVSTLRSGWLTTGPKTQQFEDAFQQFLGGEGITALAVSSATAGLHLALESIGTGPGDEVITTPHTFTATAEVIRYLGADPVFVDIDPHTLNIDPQQIEAAITPRTKAILPVHFAGMSADMTAIANIARRHGLRVIEDAAHALPAKDGDALIGTLSSAATVFSFYATKTLATGEGGMLVTRDEAIARRCRTMRLHGIDRDVFGRNNSTRPAWFYQVVAPGFKYNMPDVSAAIGIHQLRRIYSMRNRRQEIADQYDALLKDLPLSLPPRPADREAHAWHLYVVRLTGDASISRDNLISELAVRGIGTSVHFIPLHHHPYWASQYSLTEESFPHSTEAYSRCISLPIYPGLSNGDVERICAELKGLVTQAQPTYELIGLAS